MGGNTSTHVSEAVASPLLATASAWCTNHSTFPNYYILMFYAHLTQESISKALIHYLYQTILMEQYPTLPDTAQKAWAQVAEKEFYSDKDKDNYISFIPFPAENIVKDNTPNSWKQPELLAIITDYFKKTFS